MLWYPIIVEVSLRTLPVLVLTCAQARESSSGVVIQHNDEQIDTNANEDDPYRTRCRPLKDARANSLAEKKNGEGNQRHNSSVGRFVGGLG